MALTRLDIEDRSDIAVELYLDRFSQQYVVEVAGQTVYDSCEQDKARAVYDFLKAAPREPLLTLTRYAESARHDR